MRRRILVIALVAGCLCAVSASCHVSRRTEGYSVDEAAREYVALAVAVGRLDPPSMDWQLSSAVEHQPVSFSAGASLSLSLEDIEARLRRLAHALEEGAGPAVRRRQLGLQVDALHARVEQLLGRPMAFEDEMRRMYGITILPPAPSRRDEVLAALEDRLPGHGSLAARLSRFEQSFTVPPNWLPDVLERAVDECRAETMGRVTLPPGESVTVEYVTGEPWSAFSQYLGQYRSVLRVNTAFPLTVDRLLALACHETYPGHHLSNSLREQVLVSRDGLVELSVQPLFSPMAFTAEALASAAVAIAFPPERRLAFERDVLFPLAGLDPSRAAQYLEVAALVQELEPGIAGVARPYLEGLAPGTVTAQRLEHEALMHHGAATLRFLDAYRGYALAYTFGSGLLETDLAPSAAGARWKRFLEITLAPLPSLQLPPAARAVS